MRTVRIALLLSLFALAAYGQAVNWSPDGIAPGKIQFGNPSRPAVLLFHGLGETGTSTWRKPSLTAANWDYMTDPGDRGLGSGHEKAGVGIESIGLSNMLNVDPMDFFDALAAQGFTVAEWDQPGRSFAQALPSALAAYDKFLADTRAMNPNAPPPVALVGHSRGGLLIRAVLNQRGSSGRVRWVITLHSPHLGSDMASFASRCGTDLPASINLGPFNGDLNSVIGAVRTAFAPIDAKVNNPAQAELGPGSSLITGLAAGETKLPFVRYVTFGGTSTRYAKVYAWTYTAGSAIPSGHDNAVPIPHPTFTWTVHAVELAPMLDALPHCTPELTPGSGDGLVTDARSHLPFEDRHITNALNHAEVLWNTQVQATVEDELSQQLTPIPIALVPATAHVYDGQTVTFTVVPPNIVGVRWSLVSGPGSVTQDGVYHAPPPRRCYPWFRPCPHNLTAIVAATATDGSGRVARATLTVD